MNESPSSPSPASPGQSRGVELNERILQTLHSQQRYLRGLTGAAFFFWLVAVAVSIGILWFYFVMYKPKEKSLLRDYQQLAEFVRTNAAPDTAPASAAVNSSAHRDSLAGAHMFMTYVIGMGIVVVASSVAVLAFGMLLTLALVVLNRRVTLRQINASLAQISVRLQELQKGTMPN